MRTPEIVLGIFQFVVLLFALSLHESAHGWMASRLGDQTARMLGRITLNPLKHIDPVGTVMLPLVALVTRIPVIGWAKPTPVNTRNFKNFVRDDILTTVAGPVSNVIGSVVSLTGIDCHRQNIAGRAWPACVPWLLVVSAGSIRSSWL